MTAYLLRRVAQGDLGYSYRLNQNVVVLITERLPKSLLLTVLATLVGLLIALPLGIFQAVRRNKRPRPVLADVGRATTAGTAGLVARRGAQPGGRARLARADAGAADGGDVQLSGHGPVVLGRRAEPRLPPGLAIVLVVIGFNFIGDGLRDSFDARLRRR
jgi:hypothetical protein